MNEQRNKGKDKWADDAFSNVIGYSYKADIYCPPCAVEEVLLDHGLEGHGLSNVAQEAMHRLGRSWYGLRYLDESNWDSDDFPKVLLNIMTEFEHDEHCIICGDTLRG